MTSNSPAFNPITAASLNSGLITPSLDEMIDVAKFFARALLSEENPERVKSDIAQFKSEFQTVKYAIQEGLAYPEM